ncbi:hypothetical protein KPH14_009371 [Odynerus spinipes]|uniref:Uncharacterized protein n=1 Tax=Odynerus spinipes TaxID=1348599 RepID=A0AAD9VQH9_9HYME|nr:hypothetical protein KPH14_009371 [Odynerus spinipes]
MLFSVVFARNIEHSDDQVQSSGIPCLKEEILHHHRRDTMAVQHDEGTASSVVISAKKNEENLHPLKMNLKKRAAINHESHTPEPKPRCCG